MAALVIDLDTEATTRPRRALDREPCVHRMLTGKDPRAIVEAWDLTPGELVGCDVEHPVVTAAHDAFYEHRPLRLRPDDVWFCIAQGFAHHVNLNSERLRERFVDHPGKKILTVIRTDFVLGRPNPWPELFASFSDQIGRQVGKLRDLVAAEFSTTTPLETAAYDLALMETFQGYFEFFAAGGCGIPSITLEGRPEDWASIRRRTQHLSEYGLEPWTDVLLPVLDEIVKTSAGDVDRRFWRSFFRYEGGSGPPEMTGWILTLFPYLKTEESPGLRWSPYLDGWAERWTRAEARTYRGLWNEVDGPSLRDIPSALVSAPVTYIQYPDETAYDLRFVSGMFGVLQDPATLALRPGFGWAVVREQ